jgi:alanyl-tRNA synthetase
MWEFLTREVGLDPARLYFTCFRGNEALGIPRDEESAQLWQKLMGPEVKIVDFSERDGMQGGRIFYYNEKKNWWSRSGVPANMPVGEPGGPDTEMFYDFGVELGLHEQSVWTAEPCHVNCDCGRFVEIGNNVFMEYVKTENGFAPLPQKNVDFGGGLERITMAAEHAQDIFTTGLFRNLRESIERLSGKKYGELAEETYAFRVVMDHMRAATFLIADGAVPSNKDQGYFTRRLIRRAIRFGHTLGIIQNFSDHVSRAVIAAYADAYPQLHALEEKIVADFVKEEQKFRVTLEKGLKVFEKQMEEIGADLQKMSGQWLFDFYQNFGFPFELIIEELKTRGLKIDEAQSTKMFADFSEVFEAHKNLSRAGAEQKFKGGLGDTSDTSVRYHTATHLLHATLKKVLGEHVEQKGSNITPERMRFDFSHGEKMTPEQVAETESIINAAIARDYPVSFEEMSIEQAHEKKAIGLFGDKYGETVKVYTVGDPTKIATADPSTPTFSREICGGPHVTHTAEIGRFKIVKEEAVSAGVRRIKAIIE